MMGIVVGGLVVVAVFVGVLKLTSSVSERNTVGERLRKIAPATGADDVNEDDYEEVAPSAELLERMMRPVGVNVEDKYEESNVKLTQAGITSASSIIYYTFAKSLGWLVGLLLAVLLISVTANAQGIMKMAAYGLALGVVLGGIFGADMWLSNKKTKRQQILQRSFPDALDLLLICVESGLALDAALARTCRELVNSHPLITEELNKTRLDLTLLGDRERALQGLAQRTDMVPFRALVAALIQTEKFGTNLADTLRVLSDDYRNTRLMIAENKAGRLPALMAIPMMLLMLPALVLVIVSPAILKLMAT